MTRIKNILTLRSGLLFGFMCGVLAVASCGEQGGGSGQGSSTESLLKTIANDGARSVLVSQFADHAKWETLLASIQSGIVSSDAQWFKLAKELWRGSDAAKSEALRFTVSRALAENPEYIIKNGGDVYPIDYICTIPFIEPEQGVVNDYLTRLESNLNRVADKGVQEIGLSCLQSLRKMSAVKS